MKHDARSMDFQVIFDSMKFCMGYSAKSSLFYKRANYPHYTWYTETNRDHLNCLPAPMYMEQNPKILPAKETERNLFQGTQT